MQKCEQCNHPEDDHITDDDYSCCVGALIDSTIMPNVGYTTYEPCPCKAFVTPHVGVLVQ